MVLDPNMAAVDENYVRILQRYKELLKNAGSMEDSDIEVMRKSPSKQAGWKTEFFGTFLNRKVDRKLH